MNKILNFLLCIVVTINVAFAGENVKFFASDNTHILTVEKAYERLNGKPQHQLKKKLLNLLQNNHVEQGKFDNVLGTYQMSSVQNITADNTEIFYVSPYQKFSNPQIFSLAKELAVTLGRESVAVFIPSEPGKIANIIVKFKSKKPTINEVIQLIHQKLPQYATAFSLHLNHDHSDFNNVRVNEVEWLGSKTNLKDIKQVFASENIFTHQGQAFLVFQNGETELL